METALFNFVQQHEKKSVLNNKKITDKLMQWSMKGNIKLKNYNFNQQFHPYQKQEFVNAFFQDPNVYSTLQVYQNGSWCPLGSPAEQVEFEFVPSTQLSMSFFDRILEPKNSVVRESGTVHHCFEDYIGDFVIHDHLRAMLLDENHETYTLYTQAERNEFLFRLFFHFCLGGQWCQWEDSISPYLDVTRDVYKEIMSVERWTGDSSMRIRSVVLKVIAYDKSGNAMFPTNPANVQNFAYLIIDPFKRSVGILYHHYGGSLNL